MSESRHPTAPVRHSASHAVRRPAALALVLIAACLAIVGAGRLLPVVPASPAAVPSWVRTAGAPLAALALVRFVVAALIGWFALTSMAALAARAAGSVRGVRWTTVLLTPTQRRLLGLGLTMSVTLAQPIAASAATTTAPDRITMTVVDEPTDAHSPTSVAGTGTENMTVIADLGPTPAADADAPATGVEGASPPTWTIRPGDHLWAVAQQTLRTHGLDWSDPAASAYLRTLIDANHDVFAVPGEPDLVYPGQVFVLPNLPTS